MEDSIIVQGAVAESVAAALASTVSVVGDPEIVQQPGSEAVSESPTGTGSRVPAETEGSLSQEIRKLWVAHGECLDAAEHSKEEALSILQKLGKLLSGAKERLAMPGRNGGWSSFARSAGLTRAEADGLVRRYRRTLKLEAASTARTEAATGTADGELAAVITEGSPEAAGEVAVCIPATGTAAQASGEAPAANDEPAVEALEAPRGDGRAAEVAAGVPGSDAAPAPSGPKATSTSTGGVA